MAKEVAALAIKLRLHRSAVELTPFLSGAAEAPATSVEQPSPPSMRGVHPVAPGVYAITADPPPHGRLARAWHRLKRVLLGPPLPSRQERRERLGWLAALAILGADAISSSVYGPEEMLRVLSQAGVPAISTYALPIAVAIVALLAILALSYWQTIAAYPTGAGGYIVATDNLGRLPGLVSAAALLVDYTLDVAVSVASGVETATSAVPVLVPFRVPVALGALLLIMLANLRGIRAAGAIMSAPIYLYIAGTAGVVALGIVQWATGTLPPYTPSQSADEMLNRPGETLGLLLVLRAFSSGAVALTGIEAISNGVPYFQPPEARNAHRTLAGLAIVFGALMLGISFLCGAIGIVPDPTEPKPCIASSRARFWARDRSTRCSRRPPCSCLSWLPTPVSPISRGSCRCLPTMATCREPSRCAGRGWF